MLRQPERGGVDTSTLREADTRANALAAGTYGAWLDTREEDTANDIEEEGGAPRAWHGAPRSPATRRR